MFDHVDHYLRAVNGRLILHRPRPLARRDLAITELDTVLTIRPATTSGLLCDHQRGHRDVPTT